RFLEEAKEPPGAGFAGGSFLGVRLLGGFCGSCGFRCWRVAAYRLPRDLGSRARRRLRSGILRVEGVVGAGAHSLSEAGSWVAGATSRSSRTRVALPTRSRR